jgi:hypothetical protein
LNNRYEMKAVLRNTKSEILRRGWTQERYIDTAGRICLVEAVGRNFGMHFNVSNGNRGLEMYKNILHVMRDHTGVDPITWNDVPGRTVKDVFELIDSVIKKVDG